MEKDKIDVLFKRIASSFSLEEPNKNHAQRFAKKLQKNKTAKKRFKTRVFSIVAAAIILLSFFVFLEKKEWHSTTNLASVSPEMAKTEAFFTTTIANELKKIKKERNPKNKIIINDALQQLNRLETEYTILIEDLPKSGNDKRVVYAMITNFQKRIEILENTLQQLNTLKLNIKSHENTL